jgi:hypothetical protein
MRLIRHICDIANVTFWRWLAEHGLGDPLNQLVYVAPHKVIPPRYTYTPRKVRTYRHNYKLEAKVAREFEDGSSAAPDDTSGGT